ncbi:MAG: hypothetical protein V1793_19535 [Pseudomonadota bacterium]
MINAQSFIERSQQQFDRLSLLDAVRSSFPVYMFSALFLLMAGGIGALMSPFTGLAWLGLFFAVMAGVIYLWVKLYQHYELRSPVKSRVFAQRLSTFLGASQLFSPDLSGIRKNTLSATLTVNGKHCPITLEYSQNLSMNIGGIIPGTGLVTSIFRPINPRTWFLRIQGSSDCLKTRQVRFDFSARSEDKDPMGGQGVRLYDIPTGEQAKRPDPDLSTLMANLSKAIQGTLLKGTLVFDQGTVTLTLFDALSGIQAWKKPILRFRDLPQIARLTGNGIPVEQTPFYGADRLIQLSF